MALPDIATMDTFEPSRMVIPHVSYTFPGIDTLTIGGQSYHQVKRNIYCWDSPLPCMSRRYADMLERKGFSIRPLGKDLGEGFRLAR
jgi:hypothetical protein